MLIFVCHEMKKVENRWSGDFGSYPGHCYWHSVDTMCSIRFFWRTLILGVVVASLLLLHYCFTRTGLKLQKCLPFGDSSWNLCISFGYCWCLGLPLSCVMQRQISQRPGKNHTHTLGFGLSGSSLSGICPLHFSAAVLILIFVLWFFNPGGLEVYF